MANGGVGSSAARHERAWWHLSEQEWDVALLQETQKPPAWVEERYASRVWRPKYARATTGKVLWGCAVIGRSTELEEYKPDGESPWLAELEGSTAIARRAGDPTWLASVHLKAAPIAPDVVLKHSIEGIEVTARNGSMWEQDVIPHELHRLFGEQTFIWGGDFNCEPGMDDVKWFLGGNRRLFEVYSEYGSCDTRTRFFDSHQQTYFNRHPRALPWQLDHVFADSRTEQRVTGWCVDPNPATEQLPFSDHAPIFVTLD
jgi:endonuclease/exonuclease/phosphatase family metal-dependent hydrolase